MSREKLAEDYAEKLFNLDPNNELSWDEFRKEAFKIMDEFVQKAREQENESN